MVGFLEAAERRPQRRGWWIGLLAVTAVVALLLLVHRILEISAEQPGPDRYEYEVTQVLRAELLETIRQAGEIK